ncbi:hypothetical protein PROFUN_15821, partial [Planoprotostelium fungivorum]
MAENVSSLKSDSAKLYAILGDADLCASFRDYLEESRCAENVFFLKEVGEYKLNFPEFMDPDTPRNRLRRSSSSLTRLGSGDLRETLRKIRDEVDENKVFTILDEEEEEGINEDIFLSTDPSILSPQIPDTPDIEDRSTKATDEQRITALKVWVGQVKKRMQDIHGIYYKKGSPYELNLSSPIKKNVEEVVSAIEEQIIDLEIQFDVMPCTSDVLLLRNKAHDVYDDSQKEVFKMLRENHLSGFLKSEVYRNHLRNAEAVRMKAIQHRQQQEQKLQQKQQEHLEKELQEIEEREKATAGQVKSPTISSSTSVDANQNKMKGMIAMTEKFSFGFKSMFTKGTAKLEKISKISFEKRLMGSQTKEHEDHPDVKQLSLPDHEIPKMKEHMDNLFLRLLSPPIEASPEFFRLSDSEMDRTHAYFMTEVGRGYFSTLLNQNRIKSNLHPEAFETIWRLMKVALIRCDISQDYSTAKSLMHMASTYYRDINGVFDYVQSKLRHMELWEKPRYWDFALYAVERSKQTDGNRDWDKMKSAEQSEHIAREHSIFFGQLGSFVILMLSFGMDKENVRSFISKQCIANGLTTDECTMLLRNVDDAAENVAAHEEQVNSILLTMATDSAQREDQENARRESDHITDELERLNKIMKTLKTKEESQSKIMDTRDLMHGMIESKYDSEETKI